MNMKAPWPAPNAPPACGPQRLGRRLAPSQRGTLIPLFVVALVPLLAMVGLALDMGHFYWTRTRLQNSIDVAALTAAKTLNDKRGDTTLNDALGTPAGLAQADAYATFNYNQYAEGNAELFSDSTGNDPYNALTVTFSQSLPFVAVPTSSNPRFVRVSLPAFRQSYWLLHVLNLLDPTVGSDFDTAPGGLTAVAGPSPTLSCPTDIVPLIVCGNGNRISPTQILNLGTIAAGYKSSLCVGDAAAPLTATTLATIQAGLTSRRTSTNEPVKTNGLLYNQYKNNLVFLGPFDDHPRIMTLPVVTSCDAGGAVTNAAILRFDCYYLRNSSVNGAVDLNDKVNALVPLTDGCLNQGVNIQAGTSIGTGPHTILLYKE